MITIRAGRGLGDSLYLRAIVDYLIAAGNSVTVRSDYPDVFIGSGASVEPFTRGVAATIAHYTGTMADQTITQYTAMLRRAGIAADVPLRFAWSVQNPALVARLRAAAAGRPLILAHGGRVPMARTDGYGIELMPARKAFACALDALADCYRVRIGHAPSLYPLPTDTDLAGSTSVADLLDLASVCDGVVAQCSFAVPMAEVFDRPLLAVWARAGLNSTREYLRTITARKVLHGVRSRFIVDDAPAAEIAEAARALRFV